MPSKKKLSREDALRWARRVTDPGTTVLASDIGVSPDNLRAARVVLGADGERALRIAQSFERIEALSVTVSTKRARNG